MQTRQNKVPTLTKQMLLPFLLVSALFALWGFANAVTDPMVQAFKKVLELSNSQAAWVQMAFYGGYFCMALPAAIFVRKYTYKHGIIVGLALYGIGALLFYPAAMTEQFWFFCLGLYVLTFGLAFLETTANPYIIAMGDPATGTRRLNFAQAFNPVGSLLGLLVAQQFVLKKLQSDDIAAFDTLDEIQKIAIRSADLLVIRDPYVVLGLVVLVYLVIIGLLKMPMSKNKETLPPLGVTLVNLLRKKFYRMGVLAQVFYVGAQIMCWTYIYQYAEAKGIGADQAANYQFIAFILFLIGRAIGTYLLKDFRSLVQKNLDYLTNQLDKKLVQDFLKDTEFTAKATKQLGVDKLRKMMKSAEAEYDNSMAVQDSQMESGQPMMAKGGLLSANKYNI